MTPLDAFAGVIVSVGLMALALGQSLWRVRGDTFLEGFGCALMWLGLMVLGLALLAIATMHLTWVA